MNGPALVTGAAGFVGRHLLDLLQARGVPTVAWHRPKQPIPEDAPEAVSWAAVELLDAGGVREAIARARPACIFHLAGVAHVGGSWGAIRDTLDVNVIGTHRVLEADRTLGLGARILVPGSATVYAPSSEPLDEDAPVAPASPYALSKLAQEQLALRAAAEGQHTIVTRSFNHIGPRQDPSYATSSFARQVASIERSGPGTIRVGNLDARRDLTDVRDTVRAYVALVEHGRPGRVYNVCSGRALAMGEVLAWLKANARHPVEIQVDPALYRPIDAPIVVGDAGRLAADTGWAPEIPVERSLADLLEYWRALPGEALAR